MLGFTTPPLSKRELRQRFVELTKKHHPDRGGPNASAEKMIAVTESYKLLRGLLEQNVSPSAMPSPSARSADEDLVKASSSFSTPGFNVSSQHMWLPWQQQPSSHSRHTAAAAADGTTPTTFVKFASAVRQVARERESQQEAAESRSAGSHGFDAAHFAGQRKLRRAAEDAASPSVLSNYSTSWAVLALRYWAMKLKQLPQNAILSVRYIVSGR